MSRLHVFAAITIGSYETTLTIYQVNGSGDMMLLNKVKEKLLIGKDIIRTGSISNGMIRKLCKKINKLKKLTLEFGAEEVLVYGGTAIREAANQSFILEQIKMTTGYEVNVVTDPQQSFFVYKGVVSNSKYEEISKDGALILDASPGKLRVTIVNGGELILTQNVSLGTLQVREWVQETGYSQEEQAALIREMISYRLKELEDVFFADLNLKTLVIAGDLFLTQASWKSKKGDMLNADKFIKLCKKAQKHLTQNMSFTEDADILLPAVIICEEFFEKIGAKQAWMSGIEMNDGIACEYAMDHKYIPTIHDFKKDIESEVIKIMKRYIHSAEHNEYVEAVSNTLFKGLLKGANLTERESLLLKIAALLHNVGRYISMEESTRISAYIVKRSEIVGLSGKERKMISEIIRCHKMDYHKFVEYISEEDFNRQEKVIIGKLTILLGIANTLDVAHCQKFQTVKTQIRDEEFRITVNTLSDGILEKSFIKRHDEFFEAMYGYKLVLREKNQRFNTL
ncbi:MAG: HD domain-containing protein [Lachnospiraceae bacterium]|nr:HD domain-containing protein [Lachnospiraceae bacterium]